jgi:N utilization substance protein B
MQVAQTMPNTETDLQQEVSSSDELPSKQHNKKGLAVRTQARRAVLQALYQNVINPTPQIHLEMQFLNDPLMTLGNKDFFITLLRGVVENTEMIDAEISSVIDRPIVQLNPIELSVLRIGTFELMSESSTPYRVVINESIELTKAFGSEGGHAYVNGVLDKLAQKLRNTEVSAPHPDLSN